VSGIRGVPPGRAGRTWLSRRLQTARHGASLLDRKLRILRPERERFRANAEAATLRWGQVLTGAEEWALRAALLAGRDALRPPPGDAGARVEVTWSAVMGARFPSGARVTLPPPRRGSALPATSAVLCAAVAYREALSAAVDAAVALAAARALDEEVAATRFRLRAVQDRWVPRLELAAAALDLALAEAESADAVRLRLAAGSGPARRAPATAPRQHGTGASA
jgi:V/A-type H+/Na+-transporting ATPase subunit D